MAPSSLTLSTAPNRPAASAAVVRAPSTRPPAGAALGGMPQDRPGGQHAPVAIEDRRAVEAGERFEHAEVERQHVARGQQRQQLAARHRVARATGLARLERAGPRRRPDAAAPRAGSRSTTNSAPCRASARSSAAWKSRSATVRCADRVGPHLVVRLDVEQVPLGVAEREDLRALGKHLDLVRRAQHDADVAGCPAWRGRAAAYAARAGHGSGLSPAQLARPSAPCPRGQQPPVARDEEQRPQPVAETVERLDRRQLLRVRQRPRRRGRVRGTGRRRRRAGAPPTRSAGSRSSRARRRAAPRWPTRCGRPATAPPRPVGAGVEERADVAVLDGALEQLGPLRSSASARTWPDSAPTAPRRSRAPAAPRGR